MRIGIDLLGNDHPADYYLPALAEVMAATEKSVKLVVLARESLSSSLPPGVEFVAAEEEVLMTDSPLKAIRYKKGSSMVKGLSLLKEGKIDAFVSAGNTGALVAGSALILRCLSSIDRPALLALLPTVKGGVAVLDVGGNVSCRPHHLLQFAQLGVAYQQVFSGKVSPTVGLLNIGEEASKGTADVQQVHQLLEEQLGPSSGGAFVGNVEGREVYRGKVDVLVTDGFTGNIFLKASEGVSSFILDHLNHSFSEERSIEVEEVLADLGRHVDYAEYPGAIVCGVAGVVVKCHGYSSPRALKNGILGAVSLVKRDFIQRIEEMTSK